MFLGEKTYKILLKIIRFCWNPSYISTLLYEFYLKYMLDIIASYHCIQF